MSSLTQGQALRRLTFGGEWPLDLSELDFSQQIIRQIDWDWRDLSGADLRGARLFNVRLGGANLSEVDALGATFEAVTARRVILKDGDFRNTVWSRSNLEGADAQGARFDNAIVGALLRHGEFDGADFRNVDLSKNNLRNASFRFAILAGVKMPSRRDLRYTNVEGALLVGTIWNDLEDLHTVAGLPKHKCGLRVLDPQAAIPFQLAAFEQGWSVLGQNQEGTIVWFGGEDIEDLLVLHDWAVQRGYVHTEILDPFQCFAVVQSRKGMNQTMQRQLKNRLLR